jgi:hypothetical protein
VNFGAGGGGGDGILNEAEPPKEIFARAAHTHTHTHTHTLQAKGSFWDHT